VFPCYVSKLNDTLFTISVNLTSLNSTSRFYKLFAVNNTNMMVVSSRAKLALFKVVF
jgi:hypothetical protein